MILATISHLKAASGYPFRSIGGALSLTAAQANPPQKTPAAFVYPSAALGGGGARANATRQQIATRLGIAFTLRADADPTGAGRADAVEALYTWLRRQMIGWVPDPVTGEAFEYARGYLAGFEEGAVWWAEEFTVNHLHRVD